MQRPGLAGIQANVWTAVAMSANAQEGSGGFIGGGGSFQPPITGRYAVNLKATAPPTPSPNRRIVGISTAANVGTPLTQSPTFPSAGTAAYIDHTSEITLNAGTAYVVGAYADAPLNFSAFDISVRLIAPTTIG
jgi:hypothetical protein